MAHFYLSYGLLWKANSVLNTSQDLISTLKQALDAGGGDDVDGHSGSLWSTVWGEMEASEPG